jgi:catechol 2,3-dioxygenase-like lactoylglutathione lyase family enzyme
MAAMTYATVGSNRLEEAKRFYDGLLQSIGHKALMEHPSGGRVYGPNGRHPSFAVLGPFDDQPATVGNGSMAAFSFDSRDEVDAFHALGLSLGGTCDGPPGVRGPGLYFSYFRDLDGNKLCAFTMN